MFRIGHTRVLRFSPVEGSPTKNRKISTYFAAQSVRPGTA